MEQGPNGCLLWTGAKQPSGYGYVRRGGKNIRAHRLVWEHMNGPIPAGAHLLHNCDNKLCVNPIHMRIGTHADNMRDIAVRGVSKLKKLTVDQVTEVRSYTSATKAASDFGISVSHAWGIINGKKRIHV